MKIHIDKKYLLLLNDLFVFGLAIINAILITRIFGLNYMGLNVYFFVFISPLISVLRFSIDKKVLAILDLRYALSLHAIAYGSSIVIFMIGFFFAFMIGRNDEEKLFLIFVLLLKLSQVNLKYLVNLKIRLAEYKQILRIILTAYAFPLLLILALIFADFELKRIYYSYILYLTTCVFFFFVITIPLRRIKYWMNLKEHISLTATDFLVALKTSIPRYFFEILLGIEMLGVIAICQQIAQLSDILPGTMIKLKSRRIITLANQYKLLEMKQLRTNLLARIALFLFVFYVIICTANVTIFTEVFMLEEYPSILLLLSFLIARGLANLCNVEKFVFNVLNSSSQTLVPLFQILLFFLLYYSVAVVLELDHEQILVLPLVVTEIFLLLRYRQKIKVLSV